MLYTEGKSLYGKVFHSPNHGGIALIFKYK